MPQEEAQIYSGSLSSISPTDLLFRKTSTSTDLSPSDRACPQFRMGPASDGSREVRDKPTDRRKSETPKTTPFPEGPKRSPAIRLPSPSSTWRAENPRPWDGCFPRPAVGNEPASTGSAGHSNCRYFPRNQRSRRRGGTKMPACAPIGSERGIDCKQCVDRFCNHPKDTLTGSPLSPAWIERRSP